jgi:molybdate transport system substrate-binding protein
VRTALLAALLALLSTSCGAGPGASDADGPLLVAAASDLLPAFTELGRTFEAATGEEVVFAFGSSGQLAQQLLEGAPMELFASADVAYADRVVEAGVGDPATQVTYAFGRLAIWSDADRWRDWEELPDVAGDPEVRFLAIANPEHAPYGRAAKEALETTGVWRTVQPRLVFGESVTDTQRLAATGDADVAIVALSLALAADEAGGGSWVLVDDDLHDPLQQDLVVTATDPDRAALAARFVEHVGSEEGRQVMRRYGFLLPGESFTVGGG